MSFRLLFLTVAIAFAGVSFAQGDGAKTARVEILNADVWDFDKSIVQAQRLIGNVRFKHGNAIMHCDSAYLFDDQHVDAYGSIRIDQGDTLTITGDRLHYSGAERIARLQGDVMLRDDRMELRTPSLLYDLRSKRATYTEGGTITGRTDNSVLTSDHGVYDTAARTFIFSRNVVLQQPDRTIRSDTMHYGTASGMAQFFGPTVIEQDSTVISTTRGQYDTKAEKAHFSERSSILTKGRLLEGDSIRYDKNAGLGSAWGNVVVQDTASDMLARGDHGRYDEINDRSMITGHAELVMIMDGDPLFLHGDSLFTIPDTIPDRRRIQAHNSVRFFKSDMQGVCDTLIYSETDSLIRMIHRPVLWSGTDQISGDSLSIRMRDGQPHRLFVNGNAFLMSQVDSIHFDQVTGTRMTGFFVEGEMRRIIAEGNCRTVYFAQEEKEDAEEIIGVNRADCSKIEVWIDEEEVNSITFLDRPDATFFPLEKVPPDELLLKGARWRGEERPIDRASIFDRPVPVKEDGTVVGKDDRDRPEPKRKN